MTKTCTVRTADLTVYDKNTKQIKVEKGVYIPYFTTLEEGIAAYSAKNGVTVVEYDNLSKMLHGKLTLSNEDILSLANLTVKEER